MGRSILSNGYLDQLANQTLGHHGSPADSSWIHGEKAVPPWANHAHREAGAFWPPIHIAQWRRTLLH
jgi:hypothetical protein